MTVLDLPTETGVCHRVGDGYELHFERRLRHSPDRVWAALTTPTGLACWLAEADIEPRAGGRMNLHYIQPDDPEFPCGDRRNQSNQVLTWDPPRLFEHTFATEGSVVRWELAPDGDGTHLTLTHRLPVSWKDDRTKVLSGWHYHMEGLDDAVRGVSHPWVWSEWRALRDAYAAGLSE